MIHVQYRVGICPRRVTHPDPNQSPAIDDGVGAYLRTTRDSCLPGHFHAYAATVVFQPVVSALQAIVDQPAHRERQLAVATRIFKRDRFVARRSIQNNLLTQYSYWVRFRSIAELHSATYQASRRYIATSQCGQIGRIKPRSVLHGKYPRAKTRWGTGAGLAGKGRYFPMSARNPSALHPQSG